MPRPSGLPKTGGRIKGTPNKRTEAFMSRLSDLNIDLLEEIAKAIPDLPPEKRVQSLIALLPYCYSKAHADIEVELTEEAAKEMSDEELVARAKELIAEFEKSEL